MLNGNIYFTASFILLYCKHVDGFRDKMPQFSTVAYEQHQDYHFDNTYPQRFSCGISQRRLEKDLGPNSLTSPMTFSCKLWSWPTSTQKFKFNCQSFPKIEWKQRDGRKDGWRRLYHLPPFSHQNAIMKSCLDYVTPLNTLSLLLEQKDTSPSSTMPLSLIHIWRCRRRG